MSTLPRRGLVLVVTLCMAAVLVWFFPLLHIRRLGGETVKSSGSTAAPPREVSRKLDDYATGTELTELWKSFDQDFAGTQKQYGRQAGLGGAWYFRIQGSGTVQSVEKNRVLLRIEGVDRLVGLELGVVVDNTVRESIGIKASQFLNSQDFNALAAELNRQVEEMVIQPNEQLLLPGAEVEFVGCAKVSGQSDLNPLWLIPIGLKVHAVQIALPAAQTPSNEAAAP